MTAIRADDPERLLQLAASLEQTSRHPLAHALLQEAQRREIPLLPVSQVRNVTGEGLIGRLEACGTEVRVGKPEWLQGTGLSWGEAFTTWQAKTEGTLVAVAEADRLLGLVQIEDQLRSDVLTALQQLRKQGLQLAMFSGDREVAVRRLGQQLGFAESLSLIHI